MGARNRLTSVRYGDELSYTNAAGQELRIRHLRCIVGGYWAVQMGTRRSIIACIRFNKCAKANAPRSFCMRSSSAVRQGELFQ
jgi:hypothetical protein